MQSDEVEPEDQPTPCARCGSPAQGQLGCGIWERRVCYPCASDWFARSPTHGDIAKKYGSDDDSCRIYFDWTSKWIADYREKSRVANATGAPLRAGHAGVGT